MPKIAFRDPTSGAFVNLATIGPVGPAGPRAVSADAGNLAELGSDSLVYAAVWGMWSGTQAEYDALQVYDPNVLYAITSGAAATRGRTWGELTETWAEFGDKTWADL